MRSKQMAAATAAVAALVGATAGATAGSSAAQAARPTAKAMTCYQALVDVDSRLGPLVAATGHSTNLLVSPWDPEASELASGADYDAEVYATSDTMIEMRLNCATTRPVARRQRLAAFRFLVLHEYVHVLQFANGFPDFDPEGEHSADCGALLMMWSWRWPMPAGAAQGSHGGCPAEMFAPAYEWLTSMGVKL